MSSIESLIGSQGDMCILGMLARNASGVWSLEDRNGQVAISCSSAKAGKGLFVEGCIVIAEGEYIDGVFYVKTIM